jgi:hypothetical protein
MVGGTPTVTGTTISSITSTSAIGAGDVTANGSGLLARGVIWNVLNDVTGRTGNGDSFIAGTGMTGIFTVSLTGLKSNTKYYARAYARNGSGTAYGAETNFTTTASATSSDDLRLFERTGITGGSPTPEEQLATILADIMVENPIDTQD